MPRGNDLQGCWVDATAPREMISLETLDAIVGDTTAHGIVFFGILGGGPFLHQHLFDLPERHPDRYSQIFTNG
jgi:hypothetical protein